MQSFLDNTGRSWPLRLDRRTTKRIKRLTGVDLKAAASDLDALSRLFAEPITVVNVIFAAVKAEADAAGISDEDFGRAMAGALAPAAAALASAAAGLCPDARTRKAIQTIVIQHLRA